MRLCFRAPHGTLPLPLSAVPRGTHIDVVPPSSYAYREWLEVVDCSTYRSFVRARAARLGRRLVLLVDSPDPPPELPVPVDAAVAVAEGRAPPPSGVEVGRRGDSVELRLGDAAILVEAGPREGSVLLDADASIYPVPAAHPRWAPGEGYVLRLRGSLRWLARLAARLQSVPPAASLAGGVVVVELHTLPLHSPSPLYIPAGDSPEAEVSYDDTLPGPSLGVAKYVEAPPGGWLRLRSRVTGTGWVDVLLEPAGAPLGGQPPPIPVQVLAAAEAADRGPEAVASRAAAGLEELFGTVSVACCGASLEVEFFPGPSKVYGLRAKAGPLPVPLRLLLPPPGVVDVSVWLSWRSGEGLRRLLRVLYTASELLWRRGFQAWRGRYSWYPSPSL